MRENNCFIPSPFTTTRTLWRLCLILFPKRSRHSMATVSQDNQQKVIKFVQELLLEEEDRTKITPDLISEKIDMVLRLSPKWVEGLDRTQVTEELIRRFSLWIGQDAIL